MEFQPSFNSDREPTSQQEMGIEQDGELRELFTLRQELAGIVAKDIEARGRLSHLPTFDEIYEMSKKLAEGTDKDEIFFRKQVRESLNYETIYEQHWETSKPFAVEAGELLEQYPWKYTFSTENTKGGGNSLYWVDAEGHSQRFKSSVMGERGLKGALSSMNDLILFERNGVYMGDVRPPEIKVTLKEKHGDALVDFYMKDYVSSEPREGWTVQEYCSQDFLQDQQAGEVVSEGRYVRMVMDGDAVVVLCEDLYSTHTGHKVNSDIEDKRAE